MANSILQRYNVDKDAFSAFLERRGYTLKSTGADGNDIWHAPGDKPGDTSLTIKRSGADYNVHVFTGKAYPLEQGDYSFSDARMKFEGIDAAELTRRLSNEGYSDEGQGQRKRKDNHSLSFAVKQTQTSAKRKYQFPSSLTLDEDALLLPNGEELKQDPLIRDVYHGQLTGNMRENIAFVYRDSVGKPACLVYRIKNKDGEKSIRQYAFNAESGTFTVGSVDNKNRRLFLEESARELSTIIFCEGEKCAYDLQRFLLVQGIDNVGVTTAGGSNNINPDVIGAAMGGKRVFILPDADPPGYACAEKVRRALLGTGSAVQVWKWSDDTAAGYDVSDVLAEQGDKLAAGSRDLGSFLRSLEGLGAGNWTDGTFLSDSEKEETDDDSNDLPKIQTLAELQTSDIEKPSFIIPGLIYQGDSVIVGAQRGVGKTWLALELALSVATCKPFMERFDKSDNPQTVLIVNAEMPRWNIKERFDTLMRDRQTNIDNILFLHWDEMLKQYNENINLAFPVWQTRIETLIERYGVRVLIIDPLGLIYSPKDVSNPNAAEYATEFNRLLLMTRAHDCTLITMLHMGKEQGKIRGTSALEDMATLEISLIDTDEEKGKSRANFRFEISKNRNGISCPSFTASLYNGVWDCQDSDDIREAAREEQSKKESYALERFRDGKTPGELNSTEYAGLVPERGLQKLYDEFMPSFLSEQYNGAEPLENLLDKYEKPLVRKTIINMYPHNYGIACALLYEAGDDKKSILQAYRAIKRGAPEPPELTKAEAERTAQKNEERKAEYFKHLDEGLRIDELRKIFPMPEKLHPAYFAEWSGDRARGLIQRDVNIRDILQARLSDNRNKFDPVAVATAYIEMKNDKQAALEELSAVDEIDKGALKKVAQSFGLSLPSKPVGRPRKEKAKSDATTSAENIQKV